MFDKNNNKKKTSQRCVQGSQVSATGGFGEMVMHLCAGVAFVPLQEKNTRTNKTNASIKYKYKDRNKLRIQIQRPIHQYKEKGARKTFEPLHEHIMA